MLPVAQGVKLPPAGRDTVMSETRPTTRYVCLTSSWRRGKVRTTTKQIDGLDLPPSVCCVHVLPASQLALSEEALVKVKRQHERGLERGSGKCLQNVRSDLEEAFRTRPLSVAIDCSSLAREDERDAVASASASFADRSIQTLTACTIVEELNRELPGSWQLEGGGVILQPSTRRLRDAIAPPTWTAKHVRLLARLLQPKTQDASKSITERSSSLHETYKKVEARRRGTEGTPEAANAERVLKKLKVLMQQSE